MQSNCVPICNKYLEIVTRLHCNCVPICNKLLQIGAQSHCKCVPICNNLLQITLLQIGTQHSWLALDLSGPGGGGGGDGESSDSKVFFLTLRVVFQLSTAGKADIFTGTALYILR